MNPPRWVCTLLRLLAPRDAIDDVLGDLEEVHRDRVLRHGRTLGLLLTVLDALDMAVALLATWKVRRDRPGAGGGPSDGLFRASRLAGSWTGRLSWLDVKLAVRMPVKDPGLTLTGAFGMAVGIAISAGFFNDFFVVLHPRVPLDEGDRLVAIHNWDVRANEVDAHAARDFRVWRGELGSARDLAAARSIEANLGPPGGVPRPVVVAEMTASGFRTARVPPLLGRTLLPEDDRAGAPPVMVLSYGEWRERFGADPNIVGHSARLDTTRGACGHGGSG